VASPSGGGQDGCATLHPPAFWIRSCLILIVLASAGRIPTVPLDWTISAGRSFQRTRLGFPTSPVCSRESGILFWHQDHRPAPLAVSRSRIRPELCSLPEAVKRRLFV